MARYRRSSWFKRIMVLSVLALAVFGGWTLYKQNQKQVDSTAQKVGAKAKRVGEALKE